MRKPTLTKEQAKAVDELLDIWSDDLKFGKSILVQEKLKGGWSDKDLRTANKISDEDFIAALYIGYEIEKTPHEQLREYYERLDKRPLAVTHPDWYEARGIVNTLNTLGINIEGVNA